MKIFIKQLTGETIKLDVNPEDSIESIKNMIFKENNIEKEKQILIFNDKELDDEHDLNYYKIENEMIIYLIIRKEICIRIKISKKKTIDVEMLVTEKVSKLKKIIFDKENLLENKQQLQFEDKGLIDDRKLSYYGITDKSIIELRMKIGCWLL